MAEAGVEKMKMMQRAYFPSRYHAIAWAAQFGAMIAFSVTGWVLSEYVVSFDDFAAQMPMLIWYASIVWYFIVLEPMYSFACACGLALAHNMPIWLALARGLLGRLWIRWRLFVYVCKEKLVLYGCCSSRILEGDDDDDFEDDDDISTRMPAMNAGDDDDLDDLDDKDGHGAGTSSPPGLQSPPRALPPGLQRMATRAKLQF